MLHQSIAVPTASRAEVIAAFSYALDLTEGQPAGHCIRACWIGMQLGQAIGLSPGELGELYYTLLLKDLGCSSNAARICELYEADDRAFKQGYKTVGTSLAATLHFVFRKTAQGRPLRQRAAAVGNILRNGNAIAQEMIVARCTRGADIAPTLCFSDAVCDGIYHLDEHWNGTGRPGRLRGDAIPLFSRIALPGAGRRRLPPSCRPGSRAGRGETAQRCVVRSGARASARSGQCGAPVLGRAGLPDH